MYGRGVSYAAGDAVQQLHCNVDDHAVHADAVVRGTQDYRAAIDIDADGVLEGDCACPHAQDGYFCKHQVALALVLRSRLTGEVRPPDEQARKKVAAAAKRAQTQAANRRKLQDFVYRQSADRLADWIWQRAGQDRHLMSALKAWAVAEGADNDWPGVKAAINALLPLRQGFLDWMEASHYAHKAEPLLGLLRKHASAPSGLGREACEHALLRLYKVAQEADDSNGDLGGLVLQVQALLLQALRAAPPPAAWLDRWFALVKADPWGLCSEAEVMEAAGEEVRQRFAQQTVQDWMRWQKRNAGSEAGRPSWDSRFECRTLRQRYLGVLQQQGNVADVIEAMRSSAQGDSEWAELIRYCREHGRSREALQHAEHAVRQLQSSALQLEALQCEALLLQCYEEDGWDMEALALHRRRLQRAPWNVQEYDAVLKAAQAAGQDVAAYREELFAWAQQYESALARYNGPAESGGSAGPDVSLRVLWLLHERKVEDALALVQPPNRCQGELLWKLARRLPRSQQAQAVALLQRVFERVMPGASSPYTRELDLVRDIVQRQEPAAAEAWLSQVRSRYKVRRNFIKGLPVPPARSA